jgi:hypothetical protein
MQPIQGVNEPERMPLSPYCTLPSTRPAQCLLPRQTVTLSPPVPHSPVYSGKEKSQRLSNPHVSFMRASTPPFPNTCGRRLRELSRPRHGFYAFRDLVVGPPVDLPDDAAPFVFASSSITVESVCPPRPGIWKSFMAIAAEVLVLLRGRPVLPCFCSFLYVAK